MAYGMGGMWAERTRRGIHGFTLIELLVVIAIISILAALLLPALSRARQSALATSCTSNLRNVAMHIVEYADAHEEYAPPIKGDTFGTGYTWARTLRHYLGRGDTVDPIFSCPAMPLPPEAGFFDRTYGYRSYNTDFALSFKRVPAPSRLAYIHDSVNDQVSPRQQRYVVYNRANYTQGTLHARHTGKFNSLFADGHVEAQHMASEMALEMYDYVKHAAYWGPIMNRINTIVVD